MALISIDIPEKPPESKIRLELQAANDGNIGNGAQENLVSNDPVSAAVERYNIAAEGLRRIYEEYEGIKEFLGSPKSGAEDPVISLGKATTGYRPAAHQVLADSVQHSGNPGQYDRNHAA